MPLTPEDVSNKRFTPVRLREGYDMGEVDQFLDEVEAELGRLTRENDDLRARLEAAEQGAPVEATPAVAKPEPTPEPVKAPEPEPAPAPPPVERPIETIRVETVGEASTAAARLLELATRNADELLDGAKSDAETIVADARTEAERLRTESETAADRLRSESQATADQVEAEARSRSQQLDAETAKRREQLFGELERERDKLNADVDDLRAFEREYRSRLRSYFTQQLDALDNAEETMSPDEAPDAGPRRLRSILGEDEPSAEDRDDQG